jgi:hypothetical protein
MNEILKKITKLEGEVGLLQKSIPPLIAGTALSKSPLKTSPPMQLKNWLVFYFKSKKTVFHRPPSQ